MDRDLFTDLRSADDDGSPSLAAANDASPLQGDDAGGVRPTAGSPLRMAYADPPYPGFAKRLYGKEPTYAGEVDHAKLVASSLEAFDGFALSTGAYALRELLPLFPPEHRVCAWVKPIGVSSKTFGLHNAWEPLIVVPGRRLRPGKRDWLSAQPARRGGTLIGRKPIKFAAFLFDALGLLPGDEFVDLFPGTGIIGRAWDHFNRRGSTVATRDAAPMSSAGESRREGD